MLRVDEPEWEPLLNFAPDHVIDFMWMYAAELADGTRLQAYKHYWTRDYLHLDGEGRAFICVGEGRYEEVSPPWLLHSVLRQELDQDRGRYSVRQNVSPGEPAIRFGDDLEEIPIEALAAETEGDKFIVIHAMDLRAKFRAFHEEAKKWRK